MASGKPVGEVVWILEKFALTAGQYASALAQTTPLVL